MLQGDKKKLNLSRLAQFPRDANIVRNTYKALAFVVVIILIIETDRDRQDIVGKCKCKRNPFNSLNTVQDKESRNPHKVQQDDNEIEIENMAEEKLPKLAMIKDYSSKQK